MRAAIYARYSSENQRPESIEDQINACRRLATERGFSILDDHVYADQAQSGARRDRLGLSTLVAAAQNEQFDVVLVDDLSRLARDNYLMLSVIAELHFEGVRVVSVADGLDSDDEEATLGIQIRGIFNELQLRDLKKKTLRGQMGQKARGFSVGERTFGYKSVPVGKIQMDKKGRPRPEGYKMEIEPREAAIVLRIFKAYADGLSLTRIVRMLNEEKVPGRMRSEKGWSPATVSRLLDNEKYASHWVWNKTESRRDPRTGRRRRFMKPESEWVIQEDESLRVVPQTLWEQVRTRRREVRRSWPGGKGRRGFSRKQKGREQHVPTIISLELRDKVLTQINEANRGIFLALSWSGIRPHEARVLRVRDWQGLELDVSRSAKNRLTGTSADIRGPKKRKAKKRRAIASGGRAGELLEWLERHVGAERRISDPDGPLFVNSNAYNDDRWWSETAMRRTWKAATVKAGVSVSLYEGTKHALGTAMKAAGVDDRVIADLFGHSDARSVLPYAKVQTAVVRNALGQLKREPL